MLSVYLISFENAVTYETYTSIKDISIPPESSSTFFDSHSSQKQPLISFLLP